MFIKLRFVHECEYDFMASQRIIAKVYEMKRICYVAIEPNS